jgi:hypothetical protein
VCGKADECRSDLHALWALPKKVTMRPIYCAYFRIDSTTNRFFGQGPHHEQRFSTHPSTGTNHVRTIAKLRLFNGTPISLFTMMGEQKVDQRANTTSNIVEVGSGYYGLLLLPAATRLETHSGPNRIIAANDNETVPRPPTYGRYTQLWYPLHEYRPLVGGGIRRFKLPLIVFPSDSLW